MQTTTLRPARGALATLGRVAVLVALVAVQGCAHAPPAVSEKAVKFQAEGAYAYKQGDLDRAAGLFSLALEYEPRMAEARNGLGLVALARGDKATAEAQFKTALSLNEELAEAHHNLGTILLERGENDDALTRFRQALAIDPGFGPARLMTGETLLVLGRPDEARWELVKLTEVEPQNAKAQASYARVLATLGRVAAAEAAAQKALALDPELTEGHRARGDIMRLRKDFLAAVQEYRAVLKNEPGNIDVRVQLVVCLIGAGKRDEADTEVVSLEKLAPARPEVHFIRSYVALNREELPIAINAAQRAIRLRPRYPEARMVLAEALIRAGHNAQGRAELQRFLDEAPPGMEVERRAARQFLGQ